MAIPSWCHNHVDPSNPDTASLADTASSTVTVPSGTAYDVCHTPDATHDDNWCHKLCWHSFTEDALGYYALRVLRPMPQTRHMPRTWALSHTDAYWFHTLTMVMFWRHKIWHSRRTRAQTQWHTLADAISIGLPGRGVRVGKQYRYTPWQKFTQYALIEIDAIRTIIHWHCAQWNIACGILCIDKGWANLHLFQSEQQGSLYTIC